MAIHFFNDFDILDIITLSDLFITMICTYYFIFFQVVSATATRYGLSRCLVGLKYDRINNSDYDYDSVRQSPLLHVCFVPTDPSAPSV